MNWLKRTTLATGVCAAAAAGGSAGTGAEPLADYRWKARPILIFAPAGDRRLPEQASASPSTRLLCATATSC